MKEVRRNNITRQEAGELLLRLDKLREGLAHLSVSIQPKIHKWIDELAGSALDSMLAEAGKASEFLHDDNSGIRMAALYLLATKWKSTRNELGPVAEELAFGDYSLAIRTSAFGIMANCLAKTDWIRLASPLALLVHDETQPDIVRLAAYRALARLSGRWLKGIKCFNITFPDDINWEFVDEWILDESAQEEL